MHEHKVKTCFYAISDAYQWRIQKIFIKGIGGISFDELIDYFKSGKLPEDSVAAIANELEVSTQYLRTGTIINEHDEKVEKLIELSYKRAMTPKYDEIDMLDGVDVQRKIVSVPAEFNVTSWVNKIPDIGVKTRRRMALMSRLWTGFFGTGRYRTPKIFQNPDFSLKRRDFWVFL